MTVKAVRGSVSRLDGDISMFGAGITAVGWLVSFVWAEETRGRTLAESSAVPGSAPPVTVGEGRRDSLRESGLGRFWPGRSPNRATCSGRPPRRSAGCMSEGVRRRVVGAGVRFPPGWQLRSADLLTVSVRRETV